MFRDRILTVLVLALNAGSQVFAADEPPVFATTVDLSSPLWNRDAWARIVSDLDPTRERIGHYRGQVIAVVYATSKALRSRDSSNSRAATIDG